MKKLLGLLRLCVVLAAIIVSWLGFSPVFFSVDLAAVLAVVICGIPIFKSTLKSLLAKTVTAELAMALGMLASLLIGQFLSAAVIGFFMLFAEFIDEFTREKSRAAIDKLVKMSPKTAAVKRNGETETVDISEVKTGDIVIVKSGEMIPVDGTVMEGRAAVNQATITGESLPTEKTVGDSVFAGTVNHVGTIQVRVTRVGKDTTLGRIIQLVEEAETSKAPIQKVADKFASKFIPLVLVASFLTYLLTQKITNAISVVVVACPCAIVLATPLAVVASIGKAAKKGIIVKGGIYLEELAKIDTIVMDKTGTLTLGTPKITEVKCYDAHCEKDVIGLAATTELHSEHPFATAIIQKAKEYKAEICEHNNCEIIPGKGVIATLNNQTIILGNRELIYQRKIRIPEEIEDFMKEKEKEGKTALIIAHGSEICGVICVADVIRTEAKQMIKQLKKEGIKPIMVTGDNPRAAKFIAKQLEIDEVYAEMLPEQKLTKIRELQSQGHKVAMIGDGINDAPALAEATVGIAMGAAGTDIAIESADVALMTDDLEKIPEIIKIGQKTFKVIKQNLGASVVFNVVGVSLAATGVLNTLMAAFAHVLPDIILFLNSSRLIET
ncbi:MAG: cation-translocating P-type ATPase [Candidatus Bathyarchaeia archaeon]